MIPYDSLQAISAMLTSERISFKGSEIPALNKVLNDVHAEMNRQQVATRVTPKPELQVVRSDPPGPRTAVAEDFQATG